MVYDEVEQYEINEKLLDYPFAHRKSYAGTPVLVQLRVIDEDNSPPYLSFDHDDEHHRPGVKKISVELAKS